MTKSSGTLKEIIHRPVTFTQNSIEKDTAELNKAISQGYLIHDSVRTETGIVYVLAKWESQIPDREFLRKDSCDNSVKEETS